jgi:hypothetical protein
VVAFEPIREAAKRDLRETRSVEVVQ